MYIDYGSVSPFLAKLLNMMSLKTQWWRRFTNKEVTTNKGERFREKGVRVGWSDGRKAAAPLHQALCYFGFPRSHVQHR